MFSEEVKTPLRCPDEHSEASQVTRWVCVFVFKDVTMLQAAAPLQSQFKATVFVFV